MQRLLIRNSNMTPAATSLENIFASAEAAKRRAPGTDQ
jgi:hypothetical protein